MKKWEKEVLKKAIKDNSFPTYAMGRIIFILIRHAMSKRRKIKVKK